jgi:hypothetical protein
MIAWAKPHPVLQFLQSRSIHLLEKAERSPQRDPCLCIARIVLDRSFQYLGASLHIAELRQGTAGIAQDLGSIVVDRYRAFGFRARFRHGRCAVCDEAKPRAQRSRGLPQQRADSPAAS